MAGIRNGQNLVSVQNRAEMARKGEQGAVQSLNRSTTERTVRV